MRRAHIVHVTALAVLPALALTGCGGTDTSATASDSRSVAVNMVNTEGESIGTVKFAPSHHGTTVKASVSGIAPGFHGFHIHENPECDPDAPDGPFTTAGGHWNPDDADHGEHISDLPSLFGQSDGTARLVTQTDAFTLDELLADSGRAVMIHEGRDNFANIPDRYTAEGSDESGPDADTLDTGDAGDRAACGIAD